MKSLWLPSALFIAAIALAVGEFVYRYPQLPDNVASHFDAGGRVDGWMAKDQFALTWAGVLAVLVFTFGLTIAITAAAPASAFNLPNKDYWLATERAAATRRMVVERLLWFMAGLVLFVAYLSHEVLAFNLQRGGRLTVWAPLGVFLAFTALWCGEMLWRFQRVPRVIDE